MGTSWDGSEEIAFQSETWAVLGKHLHPGAFIMAFGGSRTFHRLACAIEDAGFTLHPTISWVNGSGVPKATRIDTQIDKAAGATRKVTGKGKGRTGEAAQPNGSSFSDDNYQRPGEFDTTEAATPLAKAWAGHRYGLQALKPAAEFIVVAQKQYECRPIDCIVKFGSGALNIDAGRVPHTTINGGNLADNPHLRESINGGCGGKIFPEEKERRVVIPNQLGRWPGNFIHDGSESVLAMFPEAAGQPCDAKVSGDRKFQNVYSPMRYGPELREGEPSQGRRYAESGGTNFAMKPGARRLDSGSAARFFNSCPLSEDDVPPFLYYPKASKRDRNDGMPEGQRNNHPCVKNSELCAHLCSLLSPPKEYAPRRLLIPFSGSGSEILGAIKSGGFEEIVGIEREAGYVEIARARLKHWHEKIYGSPVPTEENFEVDF